MRSNDRLTECSITRRILLGGGAKSLALLSAVPLLDSCDPGDGYHAAIGDAALPLRSCAGGCSPNCVNDDESIAQATLPQAVAGVRIPDSCVARASVELVRTVSSETLYNHCVRTYLFAALALGKSAKKFDEELVFIASMLHDLGLVDAYMTENERFEVDGADAAVAFLQQWGLPEDQLETIWDAIALHTSIGIVTRKRPNIAAVSLGSGMDIGGIGLDQLDQAQISEVLLHFPRLGFKQEAVQNVLHICEKKPFSTLMTAFAEVGRRHNPLFPVPTLEDILLLAPFAD